jgi:AhpD family alkylhydroperoxidase
MKMISLMLLFVFSILQVQAADPKTDPKTNSTTMTNSEAEKTYQDIKSNLGLVPTFLREYPRAGITGAWMDMKGIQLNSKTAIPGKYKELIGLAVAAQVPCKYCVYFHTQAAMLNKANKEEIKEAIALSAMSRRWSTYFYGIQLSKNDFKKDIDRMMKFTNDQKNRQAMEVRPVETSSITTPDAAYKDMEATLGFVPGFMKVYPASGVVGVWREFKELEMNPKTMIPAKYKELIGLAVAAQTPCPYCLYYNTQMAITLGATKEEISEAAAMGGITRLWSTVLNGLAVNEGKFRSETDQIMRFIRSKMNREVSSAQ